MPFSTEQVRCQGNKYVGNIIDISLKFVYIESGYGLMPNGLHAMVWNNGGIGPFKDKSSLCHTR